MSLGTSHLSLQLTCPQCGHIEDIPASKRELAFGLMVNSNIIKSCPECATPYNSLAVTLPPIDRELLEEWVSDEELHFASQDEELHLLSWDLVPDILEILNGKEYIPDTKRNILLYVLCELIENYVVSGNNDQNILKEKIIEFFQKDIEDIMIHDGVFAPRIQEILHKNS